MPGFLYFVPDLAQTPDKGLLKELGLDYAFARQPTPAGVVNGPDKKSGQLLFDPDKVASGRAQYQPACQRWQKWKTAKGREVYVGIETGSEPGPGDLQRPSMITGTAVELADESVWIVPIARDWSLDEEGKLRYAIVLPQSAALDESGQWSEGEVLPRYRRLWEINLDYYHVVRRVADEEATARVERSLLDMAAECLAANYRVQSAECSLLGLLSFVHAKRVLDGLIQRDALEEVLQKKMAAGREASATSASSSGLGDLPRDTVLPS